MEGGIHQSTTGSLTSLPQELFGIQFYCLLLVQCNVDYLTVGLLLGEPIAVKPAFPEYSWLVSVKVDVWCRGRHVVTCRSRPSTLSCIKTNNELLLLASTRFLSSHD